MIRITPKDAKGMMDAYSKVYAPKEEEAPEKVATAETPAKEEPAYRTRTASTEE